ncbi:hypothetical protein BDR26DRAFT_890865 [Obelidium mucronatum]|nr:hypothetical protein BDR26DRAFT_890865 [Obelidium mucronatum]
MQLLALTANPASGGTPTTPPAVCPDAAHLQLRDDQARALNQWCAETTNPTHEEMRAIASSLDIDEHRVQLWLQDMRKHQRKVDTLSSPPYGTTGHMPTLKAPYADHSPLSQNSTLSNHDTLPPLQQSRSQQNVGLPPLSSYAHLSPHMHSSSLRSLNSLPRENPDKFGQPSLNHSNYTSYPQQQRQYDMYDNYNRPNTHSTRLCIPRLPVYKPAPRPQKRKSPNADDDDDDGSVSSATNASKLQEGKDNTDYKKSKRFIMSREHLKWLKNIFDETPFPTSERMQHVSDVVGMDRRQVRVWFQNRRAVEKRKGLASAAAGGVKGAETPLS